MNYLPLCNLIRQIIGPNLQDGDDGIQFIGMKKRLFGPLTLIIIPI